MLGRTGFVTVLLRNIFHVNIYNAGFNLYGFLGLTLTYMYFQFSLMVLIMAPAALAGGNVGGRVARRVRPGVLRAGVVTVGVVVAVSFWR